MNTTNQVTVYEDSLFKKVMKELRASKDKSGRKRNLTPEMLRSYLFYLNATGEYRLSAESAGITEKSRQRYMSESKTFREVSNQAKQNIELRAKLSFFKLLAGEEPHYTKVFNPSTKKDEFVLQKKRYPSERAVLWYMMNEQKSDEGEIYLGEIKTEQDQQLLLGLLQKHADYLESKNTK